MSPHPTPVPIPTAATQPRPENFSLHKWTCIHLFLSCLGWAAWDPDSISPKEETCLADSEFTVTPRVFPVLVQHWAHLQSTEVSGTVNQPVSCGFPTFMMLPFLSLQIMWLHFLNLEVRSCLLPNKGFSIESPFIMSVTKVIKEKKSSCIANVQFFIALGQGFTLLYFPWTCNPDGPR